MELLSLADRLKELRDHKKELQEETKALNAEIEEIESQLVEKMVYEEVQNFNRNGMLFYLKNDIHVSPAGGKREELYRALKKQGLGDLVKETVHSRSLSATVKAEMEENEDQLPEWLNGLVNVFEKTSIGMRRSK